MIELPDLESELLRACLFIESFETLVEECKLESKHDTRIGLFYGDLSKLSF